MYDAPLTWLAALAILVLNLPFGYWRAGLRKLSAGWFLAIHAPIPLAIGLRFLLGLPLRLATLPVYIAAFFAGQWLGAWLRRRRTGRRLFARRREGAKSTKSTKT